ncbi:MAG: RnfABCDGE type electron transport complex subunit G [Synergistaceae bacterium]|nr:RnfABCDGE type electron transport complex subunit G [Synergistaceae bacterium]
MRKIIKLGLILLSITAITGLVLGAVYSLTLEPIAVAKQVSLTKTQKEAMPSAARFTEVKPKTSVFKNIYEASDSKGNVIGHIFVVETKGFGGIIELIVGISHDKITGVRVLTHSETPGLGAKSVETGEGSFIEQFSNKILKTLDVVKGDVESDSEVAAISGATITSKAITDAVNHVVDYYEANFKGKN